MEKTISDKLPKPPLPYNSNLKNSMNNLAQGKGFISPKNDPILVPNLNKLISPGGESSKTTALTLLEKKKMNLETLTLTSGRSSNDEEKKYEKSNRLMSPKPIEIFLGYSEYKEKNEKTSRLTSPKQLETVMGLNENKEKPALEIEKMVTCKNVIKTLNNSGLYNVIQVK